MHSQWSLKANPFFLSNSFCICFTFLSSVLPVLGQPPLLFPVGVGAAGPAAFGQQKRVHPEGDANLHTCKCFFFFLFSTRCSSFFIHLRACLHFLFGLQTPPTHLFYFKRIQINPPHTEADICSPPYTL